MHVETTFKQIGVQRSADTFRLSRNEEISPMALALGIAHDQHSARHLLPRPSPGNSEISPKHLSRLVHLSYGAALHGPVPDAECDRRWETEKANLVDMHLRLDELGFHASIPGLGSGVMEWAAMQNWREGPNVFTMQSGVLTRVVPTSVLTDLEQDELRELLLAKIGLRRDT